MSDISLYLDEDVRVLLAEIMRSRGYNVLHVLECGRSGKSDADQLAYAVKRKMALLTHNIRDYRVLAGYYAQHGKKHSGIIVSQQLPINELLKRSLKFLSSNNAASIKNRLIWLQDYKC